MNDQLKERAFWRGLGIAVLAVGSVPMLWSWRGDLTDRLSKPSIEQFAQGVNDSAWTIPNRIAVQFKSNSPLSILSNFGASYTSSMTAVTPEHANLLTGEQNGLYQLLPGVSLTSTLAKLNSDPRVEAADVVHLYKLPEGEASPVALAAKSNESPTPERGKNEPNDPRYKEQWNFKMIKAEDAWAKTRGKGVVVAVIDTGVAYADTKKGKGARDFKGTKFVPGYDFVAKDALPNDDQGHGTHVAGTIAETTNNNEGVAGIAYEASVMPLKVLSASGSGTSADIANAIRWAADHGANVINMSLGSPYSDRLMKAACEYAKQKGVTIICAAGNSGHEGVGYPAAYKDCVAISAVGPSGDLSFYSSWGREVALAAPGGDTKAGGEAGGILQNTLYDGQDDYFAFQGTSMASPHAAAVAALVVSQGVKDPDEVKAILQKSAVAKGDKKKYGAGVLDAAAAVDLAGKSRQDGVTRFWTVLGLFAGCAFIGKLRGKSLSSAGYPILGTMAISLGFLFPDWLSGYLGFTSQLNLIGHSVLVPGTLLALGARNAMERRMLGWVTFGLIAHLTWELCRGAIPFGAEIGFWQFLPWAISNTLVGAGILLAGLHAKSGFAK